MNLLVLLLTLIWFTPKPYENKNYSHFRNKVVLNQHFQKSNPAVNVWIENEFPVGADNGSWKLVKATGGVQSYVRWITNNKGIAIRERRGEMTVDCTQQQAVNLLADNGATSKWMKGVSENYNITRISRTEWYTYTLFNIPWPFNNRDLVSFCKMLSDTLRGTVSIVMVCKDKYVPLKPGITRLTDYHAIWVITKLGEKTIKISFDAISNAPPIFPRPIQDPIIERIFHNNLVNLKELLSS